MLHRPGLTVVGGTLDDQVGFQNAIRGAEVLLCCLGTHSSRMATKVTLMQTQLPLVARAMQEAGVPRLVLLSAYGIGDTSRSASWLARLAYRTVVGAIYQDKAISEAALARTGVQWTGIYPVMLTDGPLMDAVEVSDLARVSKVAGLTKVSRANVAKAMLDAAEDVKSVGLRLLVAPRGAAL